MTTWCVFAGAVACSLALAFLPGFVFARLLRVPRLLAVAVGPALTAGVFALGALVCSRFDEQWNLISAACVSGVAALAFSLLRLLLTRESFFPAPRALAPATARWVFPTAILVCAFAAVGPILYTMPGPDAILQRWDTLYHLGAIEFIRSTGDGSVFKVGSLGYTDGRAGFYPAGFHDIAALLPGVPTPITLNAAVITLATVPWTVGIAVLARILWPRASWAPTSAACLALLAPSVPLNEWVHLSPVANLAGFSFLPGTLAIAVASWQTLLRQVRHRSLDIRCGLAAAVCTATALVGIAFVHPNALFAACVLLSVVTACDAIRVVRNFDVRAWHRALVMCVPVAYMAPIVAVCLLPSTSPVIQNFSGGLTVPAWQGAGELLTGLLTVWPMAIGVGVWVLSWIGIVAFLRRGTWSPVVCALVVGILYFDSAIDSPLNLSALWYRGQDRLSMVVTLVMILCAVAGIERILLFARAPQTPRTARMITASVSVVIALALVATSVGARASYAALNFDLDMPNRNRFFDTEELEMLKSLDGRLDPRKKVLASPFSGGSHLWALNGQSVHFRVLGQTYTESDAVLIRTPELIGDPRDPGACARLTNAGIGYVYVDARYYNYARGMAPLTVRRLPNLGDPLASTSHSALYELHCE